MSELDMDLNDDEPTKRHFFGSTHKRKKSQEPAKTFSSQEMSQANDQGGGSRTVRLHLTHIDPWSAAKSAFMLGVTIAFLNCINMLGGSFFHSTIGWAMDMFWTGLTDNGIRQYAVESYQKALLIIPLSAVVGGGLVVILKVITQNKSQKS